MAKGLRASVKKGNRSKLRANVFGPVEAARAERLHAKLLETVNQPKPEPPKKSDMDVDSAEDGNAQQTTQEGGFPKGSSFFTASIPASLSDPSDEPMDPKDQAKDNLDCRNLFFYLGLCSDVVGFADDGALKFAFDPLPPQLVK